MQKKLILPIAMLLTMMTLALVSAAEIVTVTVPVTYTNYTTLTWSCTTEVNATDRSYNVTMYYNAAGGNCTIGEGGTKLGSTVQNTSADQSVFTASPSIEGLDDLLTYNFSCYGDNESEQVYSTGITHVGIDNTDPVITPTTDYEEITLSRIFKYTTTISDATSGLDGTETCTIVDPLGDSTSVSTSASGAIFDDTGIAGDYNLSCSATDTAENVNSNSVIVKVKTTGAPLEREERTEIPIVGDILEKLKGIDRTTLIVIIVIIVAIVLASRKR